jgi:hypothetical protein
LSLTASTHSYAMSGADTTISDRKKVQRLDEILSFR